MESEPRISLNGIRRRKPLAIFILISVVWTGLTVFSAFSNYRQLEQNFYALARERGQGLFDLMEIVREWNARHDGVYARITPNNQPNPYLHHSKRDIEADGLKLTLINPAFMMRQISDLSQDQAGLSFHVTSLKPLRPDNAPDDWEREALLSFEQGDAPKLELVQSKDQAAFRYIAPLKVSKACLSCHVQQGYKLNDIRGGVSVTMPAGATLVTLNKEIRRMLILHGVAYLLISGLLVLLYLRTKAHFIILDAVTHQQEILVEKRTTQLTEANAALERSNAELEQFAYAVSHDLQEPLRMVASYVQLLGRRYQGKLDEDADAFIGFAADGAKRMQRMITDLLEYSRVQTKGDPFQLVSMQEALDLALGNLDLIIKESEAEVVVAAQDGLPTVYGDKGQLGRLFQNLIGNAIKYRSDGRPPHIQISAERRGTRWTIAVEDNGIGIEPQHFERIFRVFQRLHGHGRYEGSGIGLAICKKIVERHGGRIWVASKPGQGTTFRFTLPGDAAETSAKRSPLAPG